MFVTLADRFRSQTGWRRLLLAMVLGGVSAFALSPFHIVPVLIVAFSGLVWVLEGVETEPRPLRHSLATGFWFGFGHFFIGLHWIVEPMLVDPERTAWMIPLAWPGLAATLAIFPALVCGVSSLARFGTGVVPRVFAFAGLWLFLEIARGYVFTGFPWNLIGYVWAGNELGLPVLQGTAFLGVLGLGALTLLAAGMPAVLGSASFKPAQQWVLALGFAIALPGLLWAAGAARLAGAEDGAVPDVRLRIVQANITQRDKWNPQLRFRHLERHIALSLAATETMPTHVIWPETAVPFFLANDALVRGQVTRAVPVGGVLITGSVRSAFWANQRQLHNALLVIDGAADVLQVYDKSHLVPFGEYVPLRGVLPVDKIVPGQGDFVPGTGLKLLLIAGLPSASPLICYEAIFPGRVTPKNERPGWLLNLTNDAWFGNFAGPRQHFAISVTRAVEEGLPMVRAANTGISAVVDPYGRLRARLEIGVEGVLDSELPQPIAATFYARWGNLVPMSMGFAFIVIGMVLRRCGVTA
ncbi:MAG: apolipoprotein N-acyltransferase [Alphaproteobacteria bacterium]|nr:apolipoprotein N-acyltransferase [Alphaproteobacteria bacterium]